MNNKSNVEPIKNLVLTFFMFSVFHCEQVFKKFVFLVEISKGSDKAGDGCFGVEIDTEPSFWCEGPTPVRRTCVSDLDTVSFTCFSVFTLISSSLVNAT